MTMKTPSLAGLTLALVLLSACAGPAPQSPPPKAADATDVRPAPPPLQTRKPSAPERPAAGERVPALPPAARSLMLQAEQASAAERHDDAAAYLERALRIAPQHPVPWQNLAVVRYRQGDYARVEGLALKSNSLADSLPSLRRANWELISAARRLLGDAAGAEAAAQEARRLAGNQH